MRITKWLISAGSLPTGIIACRLLIIRLDTLVYVPTSSFAGLDPERLDDLAAELRRQSTVLDDAHRSVRTALG